MQQKSSVALKEPLQTGFMPHAKERGSWSANILICCPTTGRPVPTGLKTDWVVFRSLPPVAIPLNCPACSRVHKWKPAEAWIAPASQAPSRGFEINEDSRP